MTWYLPFKISIAKTDVFAIECLDQIELEVDIERLLFSLAVKMPNFWGPKKDKKVINSPTKCLISVKIAILTPHIIPLPLVNVWLISDLQKYVSQP